jgi:2-iminoacetate synthase ThiH
MKPGWHSPRRQSAIEQALGNARDGNGIDRNAALLLAEEAPLESLLSAASDVRILKKGTVITFSGSAEFELWRFP